MALAHSGPLPPAGACGTPVGSAVGRAVSCPHQRPAWPPPSTAAPCPTHLWPVCVPSALPWIPRSGRGLVTLGEGPLSAAQSPQSSPDPAASGGLMTPPPSLWGSGQQLPPGGSGTTLLALLLPVLLSLHTVLPTAQPLKPPSQGPIFLYLHTPVRTRDPSLSCSGGLCLQLLTVLPLGWPGCPPGWLMGFSEAQVPRQEPRSSLCAPCSWCSCSTPRGPRHPPLVSPYLPTLPVGALTSARPSLQRGSPGLSGRPPASVLWLLSQFGPCRPGSLLPPLPAPLTDVPYLTGKS